MRRWLHLVLGRHDILVHEAVTGTELLLLLTSLRQVDLVISDVRMPLLDGLEALAMVRAAGIDTPFLLITAFGDAGTRRSAELLDAAVLDKPFSANELLASVGSLASLESGPAGSNGSG